MPSPIPAIIVVEDEPDILVVLRRVLRDLQLEYDIITVDNARSALAQAVHHTCALLITDYMLGGMNGLDLAREIKARYGCPIIMVTAYATDDLRAAGQTIGIERVIAKPFRVDTLEDAVRATLHSISGT